MKATGGIVLTMSLEGDAGYCNKSKISFVLEEGINVSLKHRYWNLSKFPFDNYKMYKVALIIPSGKLEVFVGQVNVRYDKIKIFGSFFWDGIQLGLVSGLSGYAGFTVYDVLVYDGLYLDRLYQIPLSQYQDRQRTFRTWIGEERAHRIAKSVAIAKKISYLDRTKQQNNLLKYWENEMTKL